MQANGAHEIYNAWHPKFQLNPISKHNPLVKPTVRSS